MDTPLNDHNLTYEETPIIEPIPTPEVLPQSKTHSSFGSTVGMMLLFIVLFAVGVGLSVLLGQFFASRPETPPQPSAIKPSPTIAPSPSLTATIADPYAGWKTTQVISGATKQPIPWISVKLQPEMLVPICDGASCASQGTYLPNGTRFTVASRGEGQLLVDARGDIVITDSSGKPFTTKQTTVAGGRKALEYSGLFSGTTVGGYTFSQMRGLMIEVDEDETLEMNHFTPSGVSADFAKDDEIFDKIVASLTVTKFPPASEK